MPAPTRFLKMFVLCALASAGCVKQDTDILARVGRKLADKVQTSTADLREKLPFRLTAVGGPSSLANQIHQRLASDKLLAAAKINVHAHGTEVELKGAVVNEEQRRRALDLAETTQGVEKVQDSLLVGGEKDAAN